MLDCLFAAAEAASPYRGKEAHADVAAHHSIAPGDMAAAAPRSYRNAADGIACGGHGRSGRKPDVAADRCFSPGLSAEQARRAAATATAATSTVDAQREAEHPVSESRTVEVRLLVTHFVAGLLVGTAAGPGKATHVRVVAIPGWRDDTAVIVSGCLLAVKQEVGRIVGTPMWSSPAAARAA